MRALAVVTVVALLAGCAAPERIKLETVEDVSPTSSFKFVDARPEPPKRTEQGMYLVWRDEQFDPRPPALIERALRRNNSLLTGSTIVLKEFTVSFTRTEVQRSPMGSYNAFMYGALGAVMTSLLEHANSPDHCSAKVLIEINDVPITASASDTVSKYAGETGVARVVEQLLDRLVEVVGKGTAFMPQDKVETATQ
jgi:hypothetical protein